MRATRDQRKNRLQERDGDRAGPPRAGLPPVGVGAQAPGPPAGGLETWAPLKELSLSPCMVPFVGA